MIKKLLAATILGALSFGAVAMAAPGGPGGGGGGVDCTQFCAPTVTLPDGTFCVLDGCLVFGESAFCNYSCFWGLPF
jgi:hypothetical protein